MEWKHTGDDVDGGGGGSGDDDRGGDDDGDRDEWRDVILSTKSSHGSRRTKMVLSIRHTLIQVTVLTTIRICYVDTVILYLNM